MKLTIGVLISNRIETVKKGLDSVKPLIDNNIAELICVDTVSATEGMVSDGSAALARSYTDKVYVFPWINDFSAARNVTWKMQPEIGTCSAMMTNGLMMFRR